MNIYKYIHWLAAGALALSISACNIGVAAPPTPAEDITPSTTQIIARHRDIGERSRDGYIGAGGK
jgi:hypothetical protein